MIDIKQKSIKQTKVIVLGDQAVGKSSICLCYVNDQFSQLYQPTLGAAFCSKAHEDHLAIFQILDTAGQQKYKNIAPIYYRQSQAAILVYDVTEMKTFQKLKIWVEQLKSKGPADILFFIVGNKIDLLKQQQLHQSKQVEQYAKTLGAALLFTSSKNKQGIQQLFNSINSKILQKQKKCVEQKEQKAKILIPKLKNNELKIKVVFLGESFVGKSALLLRFVKNSFSQDCSVTIGIDYAYKIIQTNSVSVKFQVWDTSGHQKYRAIIQPYIRLCHGLFLIFDITKMASFNELANKWMKQVQLYGQEGALRFLIGNKTDLKANRQVPIQKINQFCQSNNLTYFECSAKQGDNGNQIFTSIAEHFISLAAIQEQKIKIERQTKEIIKMQLSSIAEDTMIQKQNVLKDLYQQEFLEEQLTLEIKEQGQNIELTEQQTQNEKVQIQQLGDRLTQQQNKKLKKQNAQSNFVIKLLKQINAQLEKNNQKTQQGLNSLRNDKYKDNDQNNKAVVLHSQATDVPFIKSSISKIQDQFLHILQHQEHQYKNSLKQLQTSSGHQKTLLQSKYQQLQSKYQQLQKRYNQQISEKQILKKEQKATKQLRQKLKTLNQLNTKNCIVIKKINQQKILLMKQNQQLKQDLNKVEQLKMFLNNNFSSSFNNNNNHNNHVVKGNNAQSSQNINSINQNQIQHTKQDDLESLGWSLKDEQISDIKDEEAFIMNDEQVSNISNLSELNYQDSAKKQQENIKLKSKPAQEKVAMLKKPKESHSFIYDQVHLQVQREDLDFESQINEQILYKKK